MRGLSYLLLSALIIAADQGSKALVVASLELYERLPVVPFFSWVHARNYGAAFSLLNEPGGWQRWLFIALAMGFAVFIVYELRRLPPGDRLMGWVYGFILGGALGNMIDRVLSGYVVDFALLHYGGWSFPAFNVADAALSVGAVLWIYAMFREDRQEPA